MALPEDFNKIYGSTATGGLTPISDVDYAKGWEFVGSNPPTKNDFSYLQNLSDLKSQWLYSNKQPLSDTLTKLDTLGPQTEADQVLFFSGKNVPAVTALTLAGRQLISKENVPEMLQYLTLGDGTGRLLGVQVFGSSGTYKKSPGVKKIIVEVLNVDENEITMDTTFIDDLGADSLDVFQIIMGLEEEFDIEIPSEAAEKIVTVGDAVEQIKNALN